MAQAIADLKAPKMLGMIKKPSCDKAISRSYISVDFFTFKIRIQNVENENVF